MAQATIEQFSKDVDRYLLAAQKERVVINRNGEPLALVIGMENKDAEDFHYMTSPEFWRMIEEARRMPPYHGRWSRQNFLRTTNNERPRMARYHRR